MSVIVDGRMGFFFYAARFERNPENWEEKRKFQRKVTENPMKFCKFRYEILVVAATTKFDQNLIVDQLPKNGLATLVDLHNCEMKLGRQGSLLSKRSGDHVVSSADLKRRSVYMELLEKFQFPAPELPCSSRG